MNTPPSPIFISHCYDDFLMTVQLTRHPLHVCADGDLPDRRCAADKTVSAKLLDTICGCRSLMWIGTERARRSRWVTLERDCARRAGLNPISPLNVYLVLTLIFCRRWVPDFRLGSLLALLLPLSIAFLLGDAVPTAIWVALEIRVGPGARTHCPVRCAERCWDGNLTQFGLVYRISNE